MITTRINIKTHLAEYMQAKYANADGHIELPNGDDLYITLYNLTSRRPINAPIDTGNLSIVLPCRREGKHPEFWNYLSQRAARVIESKIELRFWADAHEYIDEQKHRYGIDYQTSIEVFMHRYQITGISEDAIRKNYYRWKSKVRQRTEKRPYKKP